MSEQQKEICFHGYSDLNQVCMEVNQSKILIPSIFAPIEGKPVGFEIKGLESMGNNSFYVVNHFGREVFKTRNYKNDWTADGLDEGDYYFLLIVKGTSKNEWSMYKGCIILKRTRMLVQMNHQLK